MVIKYHLHICLLINPSHFTVAGRQSRVFGLIQQETIDIRHYGAYNTLRASVSRW